MKTADLEEAERGYSKIPYQQSIVRPSYEGTLKPLFQPGDVIQMVDVHSVYYGMRGIVCTEHTQGFLGTPSNHEYLIHIRGHGLISWVHETSLQLVSKHPFWEESK